MSSQAMPSQLSEKTAASTSRAAAEHGGGKNGQRLPAVPVLQQKAGEQEPAETQFAHSGPVSTASAPVQMVKESEFVANPEIFMQQNVVLFEYGKGFRSRYPRTMGAVGSRITPSALEARVKLVMGNNKEAISFYLQESGTAADRKPIYFTTPAIGILPKSEIKAIFKEGAGYLEDADTLVDTLVGEDGGGDNIRANYAPYFTNNPNMKKDGSGKGDADTFENVGSTVVDPRTTNFVFTDAMNGCAYGITKVEGDDVKFEAWHFQSEGDNFNEASHFRTIKGIRDWFGVNDYYIGDGKENLAATNIIWNKAGNWKMLSQKNVVPLNGSDPTVFKESTTHDLNVGADISEDRLTGVHSKIMAGRRKGIDPVMIKKINDDLKALTVPPVHAINSAKVMESGGKSMKTPQVAEINKLSTAIATKRYAGYPANATNYNKLAALKGALETIVVKGILSDGYDETKTLPIKQTFMSVTNTLYAEAFALLTDAKTTTVTADEAEFNEALVDKLTELRFYFDLYDSTVPYRATDLIITNIGTIKLAKKGVASKGKKLADERGALFPPPGPAPVEAPGPAEAGPVVAAS